MGSGVSISSTLLVASRADAQVQRPVLTPRAAPEDASSRDRQSVVTATRFDTGQLDLATVADAKSVAPAMSSDGTEAARPEPTPAPSDGDAYSKRTVARAATAEADAPEPDAPQRTPPKGSTVNRYA
ncbi:hypothetical protein L6R52_11955 [Myxococcota bacterium]|nr:hypothetical protein [Myxococcota bacterium]